MSTVDLNIPEDVMQLVAKITRFELQYPQFVKQRAETVVNQEIVDKIRDKMEAKGYDKKIIQQVRVEFVSIDPNGFIEFDIISDYETDEGFDVAKMMEEGRRGFFDKPVIKQALSWIVAGLRLFSKGHFIPIRPGDKFVKSTIDEMEETVQNRLNTETDDLLNRSIS